MAREIRPPVPPGARGFGFLKYYMFNPCDAPFMLYIELALPIAGEIAVMLLSFDLVGFVKRLFRPKWIKTYRHTRRGPRGRPRGGGIPEIGDLLADQIDPDKNFRPYYWRYGGQVLIEIHDQYERAFWTIFLYEVIEGFLFRTIIGVIEESTDGCPHIGRMLRVGNNLTTGAIAGDWAAINVPNIEYINNVASSTGFAARPLEGVHSVCFAATITKTSGDGDVGMRFATGPGGNDELAVSGIEHMAQGETRQIMVSMNVKANTTYHWQTHCSFGFMRLDNASVLDIQTGE